MSENIVLKKDPKIEIQLLDKGFNLIDGQTESNSGFYAYNDIQSIELNKAWFPGLAIWLRIVTSFMNMVPFFPDADSYKKSNLIFHFKKMKLGIWLTNTYMAEKARKIKALLDEKTKHNNGPLYQ